MVCLAANPYAARSGYISTWEKSRLATCAVVTRDMNTIYPINGKKIDTMNSEYKRIISRAIRPVTMYHSFSHPTVGMHSIISP